MFTCTFFGHRDSPKDLKPILRSTLAMLIEYDNVKMFYLGNQGSFDSLVCETLQELKLTYPEIHFYIILAYPPKQTDRNEKYKTIYPNGIETVPKRFAISWHNKWMLENSDYVVTYVNHYDGGAAKFKDLSIKKSKIVINLADFPPYEDSVFD